MLNNSLQGYYKTPYVNDVSREMRVYISLFPLFNNHITIPNIFSLLKTPNCPHITVTKVKWVHLEVQLESH